MNIPLISRGFILISLSIAMLNYQRIHGCFIKNHPGDIPISLVLNTLLQQDGISPGFMAFRLSTTNSEAVDGRQCELFMMDNCDFSLNIGFSR